MSHYSLTDYLKAVLHLSKIRRERVFAQVTSYLQCEIKCTFLFEQILCCFAIRNGARFTKLSNSKAIFLTSQMCIETFTKTAILEVMSFGYFQSGFCLFTKSYCNKHAILKIDSIA